MRASRGMFPYGDMYSRRIQEFSGNLVAHWPFDERHGAVAYDKSIGGFDGAITTATPGVAGIGDGLTSMSFDGTNDYIDISAIASNLVTNGGFETAGGGGADVHASWTENVSDGAIANEAVIVHTGADALKLTAGAGKDTYDDQNVTVVAGSTNKIRLWVYGDGSDEGQYSIYDNDNAGDIVATTGIGETAAAWNMVDISFDAPAGCTSARIRLQCPDANGGIVYYDTISLRRTDIPTFDPHEGSVIVWAKVSAAGVWTDGTDRYSIELAVDASNRVRIRKNDPSSIDFIYGANGTTEITNKAGLSTVDWIRLGITWSLSGDAVIAYYNGAQEGATHSGIGTWTGTIDTALALIGSRTQAPANAHSGNLAHVQIYNTPLSADEMKYLMTLP